MRPLRDGLAVAVVIAMVALLVWIFAMVLNDNGPSCEETGGRSVLRGFIQVGKVMVPHYECVH